MREGRTIQNQLSMRAAYGEKSDNVIRVFSKLVFEGKIHAALRYLSGNHSGGVLDISEQASGSDRTVFDVLREKHPEPQEAHIEASYYN